VLQLCQSLVLGSMAVSFGLSLLAGRWMGLHAGNGSKPAA
jgi:hypothetical protein